MYTCDFVRVCAFEHACVRDFTFVFLCVKLCVFLEEEMYQKQMKITSEQREETEIEQERRIHLIGWELLVQKRKKKPEGMKRGNKRKRIILMRVRKKEIIFNLGALYLQQNIQRNH